MGIRINYGISKKKNTEVCIKGINALLKQNSGESLILLVPEQFSSYYEQLIVEKSIEKGSFRAEILTFKRLAFRVFAKHLVNGSKYLDQAGKSMLMYESVSSLSDRFEAFAKAGKYPAFATEAIKTIREFKRYRISPEILKETAEKIESLLLKKKLNEMADVYSTYEEKMKSGGFCDADDNLMDLASLISKNDILMNRLLKIKKKIDKIEKYIKILDKCPNKKKKYINPKKIVAMHQIDYLDNIYKSISPDENILIKNKNILSSLKHYNSSCFSAVEKEIKLLEERNSIDLAYKYVEDNIKILKKNISIFKRLKLL